MDNSQAIKKRIICVKGRFYDTGTSNKSFLQVAMDLKTLGVREWYFMLEIKDPSLINVDPFAVREGTDEPTLTKDQISRITIECVHNIWYYLREVVRIPDQGSTSGGARYRLDRGNLALNYCMMLNLNVFIEEPRRIC